ncbi:MAG: hypothetical protein IKY45_02470 [Clostridia bacterium]|nr:hypothetical protein [Clostridia bacterium]MBR4973311.1 hypothetical protein [Clostridia bacterium]
MNKTKDEIMLFSIGAIGYGLLEIVWRGFTHWSMLTAGGICFLFFSKIAKIFKNTNLLIKGLIGSAFITSIEFIFGVIFNIILKKNVWDYSKMPFNLCGQICIAYSAIWTVLSMIFIPFADFVSQKIKNNKKRIV